MLGDVGIKPSKAVFRRGALKLEYLPLELHPLRRFLKVRTDGGKFNRCQKVSRLPLEVFEQHW